MEANMNKIKDIYWIMVYFLETFLRKTKEEIPRKIAWILPKEIIKWAFIKIIVNATTGKYSNQNVPELTTIDALRRW